jgi:hypothetical protein
VCCGLCVCGLCMCVVCGCGVCVYVWCVGVVCVCVCVCVREIVKLFASCPAHPTSHEPILKERTVRDINETINLDFQQVVLGLQIACLRPHLEP